MAKKKYKEEEISVSFHSLFRQETKDDKTDKIPFSIEEFKSIYEGLRNQQEIDYTNEDQADKVRSRDIAPIAHVELENERIICGQYKAAYWGHSYENTDVGTIDSNSINLRPFFFLLYLAENGRVFIASQYLGNFGGYTALKNTIFLSIQNRSNVTATSFNIGNASFEGLEPRELVVSYSQKETKIAGKPKVSKAGIITFKKQGKDDPFGEEIKDKLFSTSKSSDVKKVVRDLMNASGMFEVKDEDIDDCRVVALLNGKRKTVYLLDESSYATRFPLNTPHDKSGHPVYEKIKPKVIEVLTKRILSLQNDK